MTRESGDKVPGEVCRAMPVRVEKRSGPRPWKIVEITGGRVVGSSLTEAAAKASARARNAARAKSFMGVAKADRPKGY